MIKKELRKIYKTKRNALTEQEIVLFSQQITQKIKELNIWNKTNFHIFLSIESKKEVKTNELISFLHQQEKQVIVPKINTEENQLTSCRLLPSTDLIKNKWEILEPQFCRAVNSLKIEVVFIPLLISDSKGNRVGYGKGFYDKLLATCNPEVIKVGINFFKPIDSIIKTHLNDVTLDFLVTPRKIYTYNF
ncbi:MAG: 5-formyltetrahydrofolate cyclo-ligase [Solirubrobacteraceae bacterium]